AGLVAYPNGSAQNQIRRSESRSIEPPRCSRMAPLVFQPKAPVCDVARCAVQRERTTGIDGQPTGTARPFPLWRLRSGLCCRPLIQYSGVASLQARIVIREPRTILAFGDFCLS